MQTDTTNNAIYTQGNWKVNELSFHETAFEILTDTPSEANMNGNIAYIKQSNYGNKSEAENNANLIAASKDMYEALQKIIDCAFTNSSNTVEIGKLELKAAKAALLKAEGKI